MKALITSAHIEKYIFVARHQTVMLDSDLAKLYGVTTKSLNLAVRRNQSRFPEDFMFQLTKEESDRLRFQFETSNKGRGGRRYEPFVFTENGVAMLSSVLNSPRAIHVNIQIMRTFTKLKGLLVSVEDLRKEIQSMKGVYDAQFSEVFDAIGRLFDGPKKKLKVKGFTALKKVS